MTDEMADESAELAPFPSGLPPAPAGRRMGFGDVVLGGVFVAALLPFVWYAVHLADPEAAVRAAQQAARIGTVVLPAALVVLATAAILIPPVPAWLRLHLHRARIAWSTDRAPLLAAIEQLQHFETAERHLAVGRMAMQRGELALAGPHLQRAVQLAPDQAATHHQFGLLLLRHGLVAPARDAFALAEQMAPGHAFGDSLLHRGRCEHLLGDHTRAVQTFARMEHEHGSSPRTDYWHAEALHAAGDVARARERYRRAAARPDHRLDAEANWFRALARFRLWFLRGGR